MLTPNLPLWSIACALIESDRSETRIVGGSADTEVNALTVVPHGRSSTRVVTITTPLASALIASVKAERATVAAGLSVCVESRAMFFFSIAVLGPVTAAPRGG